MKSVQIIFWVLFAVVFYTYIGYGVLVFILAKLKNLLTPKGSEPVDFEWPEVTLLIAAYNEEAVVKEKMENSLSLEAPPGKLKIVWVTDGSDDSVDDPPVHSVNNGVALVDRTEDHVDREDHPASQRVREPRQRHRRCGAGKKCERRAVDHR